jgi:hypothetical protein
MPETDLFESPQEDFKRIAAELRDIKEALREIGARLARVENRARRAFPSAFPQKPRAERGPSAQEEPTLTAEQAMVLYSQLVDHARNGEADGVQNRLARLGIADLSLLRRELGAPLGKSKPSRRTLTHAIMGRLRESVMLSKHTTREAAGAAVGSNEPAPADSGHSTTDDTRDRNPDSGGGE